VSESRRPRLRHRLEYLLVRLVAAVVRILPARLVLACGTAIGLTFYALDRPHRRLTAKNLEAAFPVRTPPERATIARGVFAHFGRVLVELLRFSTLSRERIGALVELEGAERVRHAMMQGRGVLLFTGHFGFWEIHALGHSLMLSPMGVVGRALDNPYLDAMLEHARTRTGNHVIYRRGAVRRILRALSQNGTIALLIDQHIQDVDAVQVEFFGRPVNTTTALAALALRTGAPVIPCFALPLDNGRYRLVYEHPVPLPPADHPDRVRELTQRCTDVLEMYVRRYPDLWLWMHRRWRDVEPETAAGMFPVAERPEPAGARTDE
jgi:KDO2-lipid IV(A) lauroyltransferase